MGDEKPPEGPDDRDEEMEALPAGPPPRRSPLLAAAVLLLSGLVLFHLRHDILYAFSSRTAADLGDARALANLKDNSYAKVRGQPDRRNALFLEPRVAFHPLRGVTATPRDLGLDFRPLEVATDDGEKVTAWWLPHPDPRAAVLFWHGNGGNLSLWLDVVILLRTFPAIFKVPGH